MENETMDLQQLLVKAKAQGFLTYEEVNRYLPDEASSSKKIDALLVALDRMGIELVEAQPASQDASMPSLEAMLAAGGDFDGEVEETVASRIHPS